MAVNTCTQRSLEGIIRGTNFSITGVNDDATAGLVQSFQLQFQRRLSRVYDLASPSFYYIEGPSEGQVSFTKIIGPKGVPRLSCECVARDIILNAGPTLCQTQAGTTGQLSTGSAAYTLKNALPFSLQGSGNAENFVISFGVGYLFNDII